MTHKCYYESDTVEVPFNHMAHKCNYEGDTAEVPLKLMATLVLFIDGYWEKIALLFRDNVSVKCVGIKWGHREIFL